MVNLKTIHHLPGTNIVIDLWDLSNSNDESIRFMTIFRTSDAQLERIKQSNYKIYTSYFNKILLESHKIPANRIIAITPRDCIQVHDEHFGYSFAVSTIDSNHCAGSCMFLFQGPFGKVLYTGFFRPAKIYDPLHDPILEPIVQDKLLNTVYIDNTYAAEHCKFPSRKEVIEKAVELIENHPKHKIIISGSNFGKEEILRDIAMSINEKIGISKKKETLFRKMRQCLTNFSTDCKQCRIIVEDELLTLGECKKKLVEEGSLIIIILTASYACEEALTGEPPTRLSIVHILPYSSHASHDELMQFLFNLKPRNIQPIILTETPNTIIPQKMLDMCYTNDDEFPLRDSDFYFDLADTFKTESEFESAPNEMTDLNNSSPSSSDDMEVTIIRTGYKNTCSTPEICTLSDSSDGNSTVFSSVGTDSVNSNVFHESETSAFTVTVERQDENENEDDRRDVKDPRLINASFDTLAVGDSLKVEPDVSCVAASTKAIPIQFPVPNVICQTPTNSTQNCVAVLPETVIGELNSNNKRLRVDTADQSGISGSEDSPERKKARLENYENQLETGESNSQLLAIPFNGTDDEEISSNDIIGSDGLMGRHTPQHSHETDESNAVVQDGSDISLAFTDGSVNRENIENAVRSNDEIYMSDEEKRLSVILYHVWLSSKPEDRRRTCPSSDSHT